MKKITILSIFTLLFIWGKAQNCWADFQVQYFANQNSLTVQFYDSSSTSMGGSQGVSYLWYLGDGSYSHVQNPIHTYSQAGTYYVCLTIYDSLRNCSDSACYSITVNVTQPPTHCNADFYVTKDSNSQFRVLLYNTSTNAPSHTFSWDFGDGTTGNGITPQHQYQNFGDYVVCLTITDNQFNCTSTFCDTVGMDSTGNLKASGFSLDVLFPMLTEIKEHDKLKNLNIYPNPAKTQLYIDLNNTSAVLQVEMKDISGKTIYRNSSLLGGNIEKLSLDQYENGFYFLILNDGQERRVEKIVINK